MKIPLASTGLRPADIATAIKVLESGNLTMGALVKKFELEMATYLECKNFIMMNSGSSANLSIVEALIRPTNNKPRLNVGDGILVPAVAWPTTIWPLIQLGLKPIFVDIALDTLAMDIVEAQKAINNSKVPIKGIFLIHPLGLSINPHELIKFAEANKLVLISDVCESLGSWNSGHHAGYGSIASSFSFYFSHHITTMEGGGVATNDDDLANDLRSIRSHGWSRDRNDSSDWLKNLSGNDAKFLFVSTGFNVRPMEIQAAIGSSQLKDLDLFVERRRLMAERLSNALKSTKLRLIGSETLDTLKTRKSHSWMLFPILLVGENSAERKTRMVQALNDLEIETRPVLTGNFLAQPALKRIIKGLPNEETFKIATQITTNAFLVGAHHEISDEQIKFLCKSLINIDSELNENHQKL